MFQSDDQSSIDPTKCISCGRPLEGWREDSQTWGRTPCPGCGRTPDELIAARIKRTGKGVFIGELVMAVVSSPNQSGWAYFRQKLLPSPTSFDSIQGLLELAEWYPRGTMALVATHDQRDDPYQPAGMLKQLEADGYIRATWADYEMTDHTKGIRLSKVWLTPRGHELLHSLREKSPSGRLRKRAVDIVWIVATSIVTTLATLSVKSCSG